MASAKQLIHIGFAKRLVSFLLALLAFGLRAVRRFSSHGQAGETRVLILEPFGLGDVVTLEPLVRVLRSRGVAVTVCARPEWRPLFPNVDWLNSEIAWGHQDRSRKYPIHAYVSARFRSFLQELRRASQGATGVDTRGDIRSVLLLHMAGCRKVITLSHYLGSDLTTPSFAAELVPFSPSLRRWESNLCFAQCLGVDACGVAAPAFPHLKRSENATGRAALIPIAPWRGKWWQADKWKAVAADLLARGFTCTGLCGPSQGEWARQQLGPAIAIVECNGIAAWAAQLQRFQLLITLDTGPMHLADALDVPLVALFGQGLLPLWAPSRLSNIVVSHQSDPDFRPCLPIEAHTASGEDFMRRITPQEVLDAVSRLEVKPA